MEMVALFYFIFYLNLYTWKVTTVFNLPILLLFYAHYFFVIKHNYFVVIFNNMISIKKKQKKQKKKTKCSILYFGGFLHLQYNLDIGIVSNWNTFKCFYSTHFCPFTIRRKNIWPMKDKIKYLDNGIWKRP
jgi:hypothetical protein